MAYPQRRQSTEVAAFQMPTDAAAYGIDHQKWRVLTEAIYPGAKNPQSILLALAYCKARGYDPFKRPVHIVPAYNNRLGKTVETIWPGINSLQTDAARTGKWAGMDPPLFGDTVKSTFAGNVTEWVKGNQTSKWVEKEVSFPEWCSVTVYRIVDGQKCAFSVPVWWTETYARMGKSDIPNEMWERRAKGQIMKCALAASLRAAFPEISDYAAEEMEGRDLDDASRYVIEGDGAVVGGEDQEQTTPEPEPEAEPKADAPAVVHFRLDGKRVKLPEAEIMEKLTAKSTSEPEIAAALVEQNWSWFSVDERKPILDAMLYAMDRNTAGALEAFILTQQEVAE
jgi:phage recombination protein Bet